MFFASAFIGVIFGLISTVISLTCCQYMLLLQRQAGRQPLTAILSFTGLACYPVSSMEILFANKCLLIPINKVKVLTTNAVTTVQ